MKLRALSVVTITNHAQVAAVVRDSSLSTQAVDKTVYQAFAPRTAGHDSGLFSALAKKSPIHIFSLKSNSYL
jgi:hypothetical protein